MDFTKKLGLNNQNQKIEKSDKKLTMTEKFNYLSGLTKKSQNFDTSILADILNYLLAVQNKLNERTQELETLKIQHSQLIEKYNNVLATRQHVNTLKPKIRQISDNDIKRIKTLRNQGLSYKKINVLTGWSVATISRALNGFYDD